MFICTCIHIFSEDTWEKQENIDGQDIQVRVMDTYDAVSTPFNHNGNWTFSLGKMLQQYNRDMI